MLKLTKRVMLQRYVNKNTHLLCLQEIFVIVESPQININNGKKNS